LHARGGIDWLSREELLSYEEMLRLCRLLVGVWDRKDPHYRRRAFCAQGYDAVAYRPCRQLNGLKEISITTNGVLTAPYIPQLKDLGH
jgi:hypothetical protein